MFIRVYIDHLIDSIFAFFYDNKREKVCKIENPILTESASSLARKIREKKLKSKDIVTACIKRIQAVNPVLNAVVDDRFRQALQEAEEIDQKLAEGKYTEQDFIEKPFLGVPFTTKESTSCKGMKWSFGLVCRKHIIAQEDAEMVKNMKNAGAILLGVTNIPQLNLWGETFNPLYGLTKNPYNTTRNVGGSSGGEACIIAACGSPMGLGTDIGGSVRIPSFMCGIFGHKPTSDIVSTHGMTYRKGDEGPTIVVAGPMARHAEDLAPMLKVIAGANANKLKLDEPISKIKVFYSNELNDVLISRLRPEMVSLIDKVVENLRDIAVEEPKLINFEDTRYTSKLWRYWMRKEPNADFNSDLASRKGRVGFFEALLKFVVLSGEYPHSTIANLINNAMPIMNDAEAKEITERLRNQIISTLGDDGVLIFPSQPWPASYHYTLIFRPYNIGYLSLFNSLKLPVTQVPLGLGEEGLPLGVQMVTTPNNDHLSIGVAKYLEKVMGGWVPPCEVVK